MRAFFKSELETLKIKTGLNQYENISALPDAEHQFKLLFDSLEDVCAQYPYIPDNDKKRIVQEQIYRDQDFNQLTPRVLWKWLEREKGKYFREAAHTENICPTCGKTKEDSGFCSNSFHILTNAKPVTYDELSPEIKKGVDNLLAALADGTMVKRMPQITQQDIEAIKAEDDLKSGVKAPEYTIEDFERAEQLFMHNKKIEYGRLFSDPTSHEGKLKEGSPTFEAWLEGYKGGKD